MKLLVTTGATVTFKPLVRLAVLPLFLDLMARHGVNLLFVQYGNHIVDGVNCLTQFVNECIDWEKDIEGADGRAQYVYHGAQGDVAVELFPFSNKLCDYIAASDFVVSHGGTGTILDVLRGNRPLVVVYNEELMDNHQAEVSRELAAMGHCLIVGSLGLDVAVFTAVFERLVGGEVQLKRFGGGSSVVRDVLYGELARARA